MTRVWLCLCAIAVINICLVSLTEANRSYKPDPDDVNSFENPRKDYSVDRALKASVRGFQRSHYGRSTTRVRRRKPRPERKPLNTPPPPTSSPAPDTEVPPIVQYAPQYDDVQSERSAYLGEGLWRRDSEPERTTLYYGTSCGDAAYKMQNGLDSTWGPLGYGVYFLVDFNSAVTVSRFVAIHEGLFSTGACVLVVEAKLGEMLTTNTTGAETIIALTRQTYDSVLLLHPGTFEEQDPLKLADLVWVRNSTNVTPVADHLVSLPRRLLHSKVLPRRLNMPGRLSV